MYARLVLVISQEMCKTPFGSTLARAPFLKLSFLLPSPPSLSLSRVLIKDSGQSVVYRCWKWAQEADVVLIKHTHTYMHTQPRQVSGARSLQLQSLRGVEGQVLGVRSHDICRACAEEGTHGQQTGLFLILCVFGLHRATVKNRKPKWGQETAWCATSTSSFCYITPPLCAII